MKYYTTLFDIFLFETIFTSLFSGGLYLFNDPFAERLFNICLLSLVITIALGLLGQYFRLFPKENPDMDY